MEFSVYLDSSNPDELLAIWAGQETPAEVVYTSIQSMKQLLEFRISRANAMAALSSDPSKRYKAVKLMYLILEAQSFEMQAWYSSITDEDRAADDMFFDYARRYWGWETTVYSEGRMQTFREATEALVEGLRQGDLPGVLARYQEELEAMLEALRVREREIEYQGLEEWWGKCMEWGVTVHWDCNRQLFQEVRAQQHAPVYGSGGTAVVSAAGSGELERVVEYVDSAIQELEAYVFQAHGVQTYAAIGY